MKNALYVFAILILAILFTSPNCYSQGTWQTLNSGTTRQLEGLSFLNEQVGWVCGRGGLIMKTTDGGNTWFTQRDGGKNLYKIQFIDENVGFAIGGGDPPPTSPVFLKTTNGGSTWTSFNTNSPYTLTGLFFINSQIGWVTGYMGTIRKTTNGGQTWQAQSVSGFWLHDIQFINENVGWVCGEGSKIYKTTNGGATWISQDNHSYGYAHWTKISIIDENNLYISGYMGSGGGKINKTTNSGLNWTLNYSNNSDAYGCVDFVNNNLGWVSSYYGRILFTEDGAVNWNNQNSGTTSGLNKIQMLNENVGYAVGYNGIILKWAKVIVSPPTAICQNITVNLNEDGSATITPEDIDNGSYAESGIASLALDVDAFDCSNVGENTVTLTVIDNNDNVETCEAIVTIIDEIIPAAICKSITVSLDENGVATITPEDIDNGSYDACGIASLTLDKTDFDCSNIGDNIITLTVTDNNNNIATCSTSITVVDEIKPAAICKSIIVNLDENAVATITPEEIDNGSYDACGIASLTLDKTDFDCTNVGDNIVTLTLTDNNNNIATCSTSITVIDEIIPTAICKSITVNLNENGEASITPEDIDNGSYDACGIASLALDKTDFDCSNIGENTIILSVTDNNGNIATCEAIVTVVDDIAPRITLDLFPTTLKPPNHKMATITATISVSDNCSGASYKLISITSNEPDNGLGDGDQPNDIQNAEYGTADLSFDLRKERAGIGQDRIYTITYLVEDVSGNSNTASAIVKVPKNQSDKSSYNEPVDNESEIIKGIASLKVFPNPTANKINISASFVDKGNIAILISNELGQVLKKVELGTTDNISEIFDIGSFSSGIYFIHIKYNDETIIRAIIKE